MKCYCTPFRLEKINKCDNINCWQGYGETGIICQYSINISKRGKQLHPRTQQFDNHIPDLEKFCHIASRDTEMFMRQCLIDKKLKTI